MDRIAAKVDERPTASHPPPAPSDDATTRRLRALKAKGWPARSLRLAADGYDEGRAATYLEALRHRDGDGQSRIVILAGHPGSGKTLACARWAVTRSGPAASVQFETPRFVTAAEFFRSPRYARDAEEKTLTRGALLGERTLVLDDLGVEFADASGNYRVDLDELVNAFYGE